MWRVLFIATDVTGINNLVRVGPRQRLGESEMSFLGASLLPHVHLEACRISFADQVFRKDLMILRKVLVHDGMMDHISLLPGVLCSATFALGSWCKRR